MKFKIGDIVQHQKSPSFFLFIKNISGQNYIVQCPTSSIVTPYPAYIIDDFYDLVDDEKTIHRLLLKRYKNEI